MPEFMKPMTMPCASATMMSMAMERLRGVSWPKRDIAGMSSRALTMSGVRLMVESGLNAPLM